MKTITTFAQFVNSLKPFNFRGSDEHYPYQISGVGPKVFIYCGPKLGGSNLYLSKEDKTWKQTNGIDTEQFYFQDKEAAMRFLETLG